MPFLDAVSTGNINEVKNYISESPEKFDINGVDADGRTALEIAIERDLSGELVKWLIDNGADINKGKELPLLVASMKNNVPAMKHLIAAETKENNNDLPSFLPPQSLKEAILRQDIFHAELFIANLKMDEINKLDNDGLSFLHWAVLYDATGYITQQLINAGANPNILDKLQLTPLMLLISAEPQPRDVHIREHIANILIMGRPEGPHIDLNITDNRGETPLDVAIETRRPEYIQMLRSAEAKQKSLSPYVSFAEKCQFIAKQGHIMGLGEEQRGAPTLIPIQNPNGETIEKRTEGSFTHTSVATLTNVLKKYTEKTAEFKEEKELQSRLNIISEAYQQASDFISYNGVNTTDLARNYQAGKPLVLPIDIITSAGKHGIGITFYQDYMIYCNRGAGDTKQMRIYKIDPDEKKALQEELNNKEFWSTLFPPGKKIEDKDLTTFLSSKVKKFPREHLYECIQKNHRHGTCSFVNRKSMVEPILFLLDMASLPDDKAREEKKDAYLQKAKQEYKKLTAYMRDENVKNLMEELEKERKSLPESKEAYEIRLNLISAILKEHYSNDKPGKRIEKIKGEEVRALHMLKGLNAAELKQVLNGPLLIQLMKSGIDKKHQEIIDLVSPAANAILKEHAAAGKWDFVSAYYKETKLPYDPEISALFVKQCLKSVSEEKPEMDYTQLRNLINKNENWMVEALINNRENLNAKIFPNGNTLLLEALKNNNYMHTIALLNAGANPNLPNDAGLTPLMALMHSPKETDRYALIRKHSLMSSLLEKGADPNLASPDGITPLFKAVQNTDAFLIPLLLEKKANPLTPNADGQTPLQLSIEQSLKNNNWEMTLFMLATMNKSSKFMINSATQKLLNTHHNKIIDKFIDMVSAMKDDDPIKDKFLRETFNGENVMGQIFLKKGLPSCVIFLNEQPVSSALARLDKNCPGYLNADAKLTPPSEPSV